MASIAVLTVSALLLALLPLAAVASWQHQIYVSNNSNTSDNSCWTGGWHNPCAGINLALRGAQSYNFSTVLLIQPGNYSLHDAEDTIFHNVIQLAMMGNCSEPGEAEIHCQSPAGLFFADSQDIVIRSLTFSNCGIMFNNGIAAALYFGACSLVEISKVSYKGSPTRAIVFEDTVGNVTLQNSEFSLCLGGVAIVHTSTSGAAELRSSYVLNSIAFTGNNATVTYLPLPTSFCPLFEAYPSLGMGAGLIVVFKDSTNKNQILVSNCTFTRNKASFGGGLLVALCNDLQGNQIIVSDTNFSENHAIMENVNEASGDGGGALVALENMVGSANTILFTRCQFLNNAASHGGGLAILLYPQARIYHDACLKNTIQIDGCLLSGNEAYLGLALYLYGIRPLYGYDISLNMSGVCMSENFPAGSHITTTGVLYAYDSSFTFSGNVKLIGNNDTVLVMHHSDIIIADGVHMSLSDNDISFGQVAVLDCSSITLGENTVLEFSSNRQVLAVVYATCSLQRSNRGCFLKYINDTIHPDNWTTEVSFSGNTGCTMREDDWQCVHGGFDTSNITLILDTDIFSCAWSENNSDSANFHNSSIFKWKSFHYDGENYSSMIMSAPTEITITNISSMCELIPSKLNVSVKNYVGEEISGEVMLKVCIMEEDYYLQSNTTNVESYCLYFNTDQGFIVIRSDNVNMTFPQNVIHLEVSTSWINEISSSFEVDLTPCKNTEILQYQSILESPPLGCCVSVNGTQVSSGYCPMFFSEGIKLDCEFCAQLVGDNCGFNRTGILCSECQVDLCVSINRQHFTCAKPKPIYEGLLLYLCLQIAPLTLFLILLMFFGVSLNYLATNSYILYSQMIYFYMTFLVFNISSTKLENISSAIAYPMWSLDVFSFFLFNPFCLHSRMTTIQVIMFQYVTAFYPLLVIVVIFAWIEMYARGVKLVFYITRPVAQLLARLSQKIKIKRSLPDSFAVLYVLSYTQLARISVQLLKRTHLIQSNVNYNMSLCCGNESEYNISSRFYYDGSLIYFSGEHLVCAVIAIVVLIVFVVLPTLCLILYPFKMFRKMLSVLRLNRPGLEVLYDAFSGSLESGLAKNGYDMRSFSGIMLLFRVVFIALAFSAFQVINLFLSCAMAGLILLLKPYKRKATNYLDFVMFLHLGVSFFVMLHTSNSLTFTMILLPFACSVCFLLYLVLYHLWSIIHSTSCRGAKINQVETEEDIEEHQPLLLNEDRDLDDGGFADRLLNPEQYSDNDEDVAFQAHQPNASS